MRLHMHAADVRHLVTRYFLDLGLEAVDVAEVQENIRIDRGRWWPSSVRRGRSVRSAGPAWLRAGGRSPRASSSAHAPSRASP